MKSLMTCYKDVKLNAKREVLEQVVIEASTRNGQGYRDVAQAANMTSLTEEEKCQIVKASRQVYTLSIAEKATETDTESVTDAEVLTSEVSESEVHNDGKPRTDWEDLDKADIMIFNEFNTYTENKHEENLEQTICATIEHNDYFVSAPACKIEVTQSTSEVTETIRFSPEFNYKQPVFDIVGTEVYDGVNSFVIHNEHGTLHYEVRTLRRLIREGKVVVLDRGQTLVDFENADTVYMVGTVVNRKLNGDGTVCKVELLDLENTLSIGRESFQWDSWGDGSYIRNTDYAPACNLAESPKIEVELYTEAMSAEDDELIAGVTVEP